MIVILLVEDNPAHAELIIRSFEDHRISNSIVHFTDGETALAYLFQRDPHADERGRPKPHIILLDLHLPGKASRLAASLVQTGTTATLTVRDDGIGLPNLNREDAGMGLRNMRYRASMIGGSFDARSGEEGGTVVRCQFTTECAVLKQIADSHVEPAARLGNPHLAVRP